ncbi:neprilysin-2 [Nephila pilipes]|uniref:Neprilysin-2 n=1 Tax=Nephila pilipes TaxID=299642 RepID=A0A8X6MRW8_NEPPI|nr:neprilysin-2 [Nephila pilipes]
MDPSTDPCLDFYQYACGGWVEKNPIPKGRQTIMIYEDRHKEVKDTIRDLILKEAENASDTKSLRNVGKFYSACINLDTRNEVGLKSLLDLVERYGGWPMLGDSKWSEDDFDWQERSAKANRDLYLDIFVEIDFKNDLADNKYYIMFISMDMVGDDEDIDIPLGNLNSQLNGETFSYVDFLNLHLQSDTSIENDTVLYVFQPKYFQKLPSLLDSIPKRTLANYIAFHIVYFFVDYSSDDVRKLTIGNSTRANRTDEQECLKISKTFMSMAIGRMFIDRYFPPLTRMHVSKMVEMIRLAYSSTIDQNTWMDENTLLYALVKLQSIQSMVGYEEWILDDKLLDAYYEKVRRGFIMKF